MTSPAIISGLVYFSRLTTSRFVMGNGGTVPYWDPHQVLVYASRTIVFIISVSTRANFIRHVQCVGCRLKPSPCSYLITCLQRWAERDREVSVEDKEQKECLGNGSDHLRPLHSICCLHADVFPWWRSVCGDKSKPPHLILLSSGGKET